MENKSNTYRSVNELNYDELNELRSKWYYQHLDDGSLEGVMGKEIDNEQQIPMEIITDCYSDTAFVDEDFFCNI